MQINAHRIAILSLGLASASWAQFAPAVVTDAQIRQYQQGIEAGCRDAGGKRGDQPAQLDALCTCVIHKLVAVVPKSVWQEAYFNAISQRPDLEAMAMEPYLKLTAECKAVAPPPLLHLSLIHI